ncbi:A/G-specific DNA-adenine glycosylase [Litoreibacter halocynthiae]|uniref:Adenine DNA glycosylase n=1 Tax=Litoreibacter halocynthiae TaxID=1242689 RepID=A0A4R7LC25_9RHOB|nr:A/G-specific adenine glycosylase [Litoreibacter halocynthiae]TDT73068.1 A/G-specific DNA-adenine glycosylase [Litoreibacter halocynthiae]
MREPVTSGSLLAWYDQHARDMPWRVAPHDRARGVMPDPYRIWLSEVMLQQTTVAAVKDYFVKFTNLWPTVDDLAAADDPEVMAAWAGLGYYARARNLLKCARVVATEHGGVFPSSRESLQALPGIGPYTSAAIASIAFDLPETVLDGNVERVMARIHAVETPLPTAKPELMDLAQALTPRERAGDYAQSVMDLGATICTPKKPACGICPWRDGCEGRAAGIAPELPRKIAKKAKPTRRGVAYVLRNSKGDWLLETRPNKGLLGGMLGWPGSDWTEEPIPAPPIQTSWEPAGVDVRHTFTHFHLILNVMTARADTPPDKGVFIPHLSFRPSDLPTVMRKVFDVAKHRFEQN